MGKAVFCDRCGKFESIPIKTPDLDRWRTLKESNFAMGRDDELLLCPDCGDEFKIFMQPKVRYAHAG